MEINLKRKLLKYSTILLVLVVIFALVDIYIWNNFYWCYGLGPNPEEEIFEKDIGPGNATLKVKIGTRPGLVGVDELIIYDYNPQIITCQFEINSSGNIDGITINTISLLVYKGSKYIGSFYPSCIDTICSFSTTIPVNFHDIINVHGIVGVQFDVQGDTQLVYFYYEISYEVYEPSWLESNGFPILIICQLIPIIILIAIIYITYSNRPRTYDFYDLSKVKKT